MAWSHDAYVAEGRRQNVPTELLQRAAEAHERIATIAPGIAPIITLGHLGQTCGVSYSWLRSVVDRSTHPYFQFQLKKRRGGSRTIHVPDHQLRVVQQWLNGRILQKIQRQQCAYAYWKGSSIYDAVLRHTGARWMIKTDIENFFPSIGARAVFNVFRNLGIPALLSFELARICTVQDVYLESNPPNPAPPGLPYPRRSNGYLPIGAPTSPMISNAVMSDVDVQLTRLATDNFMRYGRYADDLIFTSTGGGFRRSRVATILSTTSAILRGANFRTNPAKTIVVPPGSRKIFLGIDVTSETPKIPHELRDRLRDHYDCIDRFGVSAHVNERRFPSIPSLGRYLWGLISFVRQIDPAYASALQARHIRTWPPL